jgi:DNA-binding transcriptional regulator LsrR (DeoR family)
LTASAASAPQAGVRKPEARFVSLFGSLTRNSISNPFEVFHSFADKSEGEVHFLAVPFIANSVEDRQVFLTQGIVKETMELPCQAYL